MAATSALSEAQRAVLVELARVRFATIAQLMTLCDMPRVKVARAIAPLERFGFITVWTGSQPHILGLGLPGYRAIGLPAARGTAYSWNAMAHACHRNEAEFRLGEIYPGFRFQSVQDAFALGLNPSFGEHYGRDGAGVVTAVLLDDYLMPSERIVSTWTRLHKPKSRHYPDTASLRWADVAQRYIVAVTDPHQVERHKNYLGRVNRDAKKMGKERLTPALLPISQLWRLT